MRPQLGPRTSLGVGGHCFVSAAAQHQHHQSLWPHLSREGCDRCEGAASLPEALAMHLVCREGLAE